MDILIGNGEKTEGYSAQRMPRIRYKSTSRFLTTLPGSKREEGGA